MDSRDEFCPKFRTIRRSTGDELDPSTTFTLLPDKDPAAREALSAYAKFVEDEMPGLARALRSHFKID